MHVHGINVCTGVDFLDCTHNRLQFLVSLIIRIYTLDRYSHCELRDSSCKKFLQSDR
ncbi:Uncharacterised protein [Segatella copri]|nr:Uncharacterised protein [Segatella copri]